MSPRKYTITISSEDPETGEVTNYTTSSMSLDVDKLLHAKTKEEVASFYGDIETHSIVGGQFIAETLTNSIKPAVDEFNSTILNTKGSAKSKSPKKTPKEQDVCLKTVVLKGVIPSTVEYLYQPKEKIYSHEVIQTIFWATSRLSFRDSTALLNKFCSPLSSTYAVKTVAEIAKRHGLEIKDEIVLQTEEILKQYEVDFDNLTISQEGKARLQGNDDVSSIDEQMYSLSVAKISEALKEQGIFQDVKKIDINCKSIDVEAAKGSAICVNIDAVLTRKQKSERKNNTTKKKPGTRPFIHIVNMVIFYNGEEHHYTGQSNEDVLRYLLAFLLKHGCMKDRRLIFITDGAKDIKGAIQKLIAPFMDYRIFIDWFHLRKSCQTFLSTTVAGPKEEKAKLLRGVCQCLWHNDVNAAINLLKNLKQPLKPKGKLGTKPWEDYLLRKEEYFTCFAIRKELHLVNSSSAVERLNNVSVSTRQKHHGMSWVSDNAYALALISTLYKNNNLTSWIHYRKIDAFDLRRQAA